MTKLRILSDLHLEFATLMHESEGGILILAGDITVKGKHFFWIKEAAKYFNHVIYINGNHEFYRSYLDKEITRATAEFMGTNVHFLDNSSITIDGITFHGSTLWTDMNKRNPISMQIINDGMNDFRLIRSEGGTRRFTPAYAATLHDEAMYFLRNNVQPGDVVITHHAPSFLSTAEEFKGEYHLNAGYASDLSEFILDYKPSLWVHGHMHNTSDYMIGDTRIVANPRGYAPDYVNPEFDINFEVEI
jgi:Icc-related predicted phosphoesterase